MSDAAWVITGMKAAGKTSFLASAGAAVPDTYEELITRARAGETFDCSDVVMFQLETDGDLGALDLGMRPRVVDLTRRYVSWPELHQALREEVLKLLPEARAGKIRAVGIDLGSADRAIVRFAAGDKATLANMDLKTILDISAQEVNWNAVATQGGNLWSMMRALPCTVVAMAHLKVANAGARTEKVTTEARERQDAERDLRSYGGQDQKLTADICKGVYAEWFKNASHIVACHVDRVNVGTLMAPKYETKRCVVTEQDGTYEAGTRARSILKPRETRTMNGILRAIEARRAPVTTKEST